MPGDSQLGNFPFQLNSEVVRSAGHATSMVARVVLSLCEPMAVASLVKGSGLE